MVLALIGFVTNACVQLQMLRLILLTGLSGFYGLCSWMGLKG